jgi:hypothetical protein
LAAGGAPANRPAPSSLDLVLKAFSLDLGTQPERQAEAAVKEKPRSKNGMSFMLLIVACFSPLGFIVELFCEFFSSHDNPFFSSKLMIYSWLFF